MAVMDRDITLNIDITFTGPSENVNWLVHSVKYQHVFYYVMTRELCA